MSKKLVISSLVVLPLISACSTVGMITGAPASKVGNISWKLFPDPRLSLTKAGEEIVFSITPTKKDKPFTVHYGDGQSQLIENENMTCFADNQCKPLLLSHSYAAGSAYYPYVTYTEDETTRVPADRDEFKIIIARKEMKEDKQIEQLAIDSFTTKLVSSLDAVCKNNPVFRDCKNPNSQIAIALLRDANFESTKNRSNDKIINVIEDLKSKMINQDFKLLEKHPQALNRLAHEAVVDAAKSIANPNKPEYLHYLDYSIQTGSNGPGNPIIYDIRVEGTNDIRKTEKRSVSNDGTASVAKVKEIRSEGGISKDMHDKPVSTALNSMDTKAETTAANNEAKISEKQIRPLLLAKFKTAKYVLLLDRIEDLTFEKSPEQYFSTVYNTTVAKRSASLKINARLVSRTGEIIWMQDLIGKYSDVLGAKGRGAETVIPVAKLYKSNLVAINKSNGANGPLRKSVSRAGTLSNAISGFFKKLSSPTN